MATSSMTITFGPPKLRIGAACLRVLGREEYSNYGPSADTGGLMQNQAPTIYAYPTLQALFEGEAAGGRKAKLPRPGTKPVTERPDEHR